LLTPETFASSASFVLFEKKNPLMQVDCVLLREPAQLQIKDDGLPPG
jgi:hypothetical protein